MNRLTGNILIKFIAVFLFIVFSCTAVVSGFFVFYNNSLSFYDFVGRASFHDSNLCSYITNRQLNYVLGEYIHSGGSTEEFERSVSSRDPNFEFEILKANGDEVVFSTLSDKENYQCTGYLTYRINGEQLNFCGYVDRGVKTGVGSISTAFKLYNSLYTFRYVIAAVFALSVLLSIAVFVLLMCSAGRKPERDEVFTNTADKIPLDLFTAICGCAVAVLSFICVLCFSENNLILSLCIGSIVLILTELIVLTWCMSVATRIKLGGIFRNTLIYRFFLLIGRFFGLLGGGVKYIIDHLSPIVTCVLCFGAYVILNLIFILIGFDDNGFFILLWIYLNLIALGLICLTAVNMKKLHDCTTQMSLGNFNCWIDYNKMFGILRKHGENLSNISLGMSRAVDEKLRQERLKTELITNVSHDIKTPLTSVINYVDLIIREETDNENIKEYATALERAAKRLKKFTEDIVEASKAATGNITANIERTNLTELLNQSIAEYEEKFSASGLNVVVTAPEIHAMTDGKLMWRVFDNLLGNICKYSQENTRVFIDASEHGTTATVTFKNTSREILNISSDELMERFVRGDESRSTEGSGLGLSIARSLTEICGGKFEISIDGDLFKASITMQI